MKRVLAKFDAADWFVILAGLAIVVALQMGKISCAAPPQTEVLASGYAPMIAGPGNIVSNPLIRFNSVAAARDYAEIIKKGSYYGAFAQSPVQGYGAVSRFGSRSAARAAALKQCALSGGKACVIVSEVLPKDGSTPATDKDSLNWSQAQAFRSLQGKTGLRSFARSLDGSYGSGMGETLAAARSNAMRFCQTLQKSRAAALRLPCQIVADWTAPMLAKPPEPAAALLPKTYVTGCEIPVSPRYSPSMFAEAHSVQTYPAPPQLSPEQSEARANFLTDVSFFSAFAVSSDGAWGWSSNYGRSTAARIEARRQCQQHSTKPCDILIEVKPAAAHPIGTFDETLSLAQATAYQDLKRQSGPRAFARSVDGSYGTMQASTAERAKAAAISECKRYAAKYLTNSIFPCQLVDAWPQ